MLREARNAKVRCRLTLVGRRYYLTVGERALGRTWSRRAQRALENPGPHQPMPVPARVPDRTYWTFEGRWYWEDDGLDDRDVYALVRERDRRRERRLERAHAAVAREAAPGRPPRSPIPRELRLAVYERDGGRCVECGGGFDLQYDHLIPLALGGATTLENLQLLCADCNRRKGAGLS